MVIARSGRGEAMGRFGKTQASGTMMEPATARTIGWRPGCSCPAHDPVPCTVLDPFAGSGTTGEVAKSLGRNFIGIELNPDYLTLQRRRIGGAPVAV